MCFMMISGTWPAERDHTVPFRWQWIVWPALLEPTLLLLRPSYQPVQIVNLANQDAGLGNILAHQVRLLTLVVGALLTHTNLTQ
jgi:hypothetical protein